MSNPAETTQEIKENDDTRIMDEIEKDTLIELETGMTGEREQLPGMPKEYSGWDVYNNEAKKVDTELVNDWRDSLNSLLLFAAIFAAVLTAFIIESKKLLESDPSDAMLEVMIFFTNSMANGTFTPYHRPQFEPETTSITINCLFFASLSASLVAALASVVALQWVAIACLSRPLLHHKAFRKHKAEYSSLHNDFTLLLARNLNSFSGAQRAQRVKEVLTMMSVSSGRVSRALHDRQGMESFFDANKRIIDDWVRKSGDIPHLFEILRHLSLAQAEQPDIGSLWRAVNLQVTLSDLLPALRAFDNVIGEDGVTPEQHLVLINSICQEIELSKPGAFRADIDSSEFRFAENCRDSCIKFIGTLTAGAEVEFPDDTSLFKASWIRIAKHLMAHEGTDSPTILKLQASVWFLVPRYTNELCRRALREPQALARLKRIFEYPVQCHEKGHDIGEGYLLLHILPHIAVFRFPVNLPALTEFPTKDQRVLPPLAALILSDGYEEPLREEMRKQDVDEWCTNQLLEMASMLLSSQHSMLAILAPVWPAGYADELAAVSICINKALDLPEDQRATSLISPLVSRVQFLIDALKYGTASEQAIARREATETIARLRAHLGRLRLSSGTNSRILSCVRATGSFNPTIRWFPPYTDKNAIF